MGLPAPWYAVYGNHDTLLLGTFDLSPQLHAMAVGGQKSYTLEATAGSVLTGYAVDGQRSPAGGKRPRDGARAQRVQVGVGEPVPPPVRAAGIHGRALRHAAVTWPDRPRLHEHNLETGETWWKNDLSPHIRAFGLDTCNQVAGPDGAVPDVQFRWLERELQNARSENKLALIFSHHNSLTLENRAQRPGRDRDPPRGRGVRRDAAALPRRRGLAQRAHPPQSDPPHTSATGGFWEITTASCIDFPQQQQVVEIVDNRDGTLSLFTTVLDHASPAVPGTAGTYLDLASRSREFAANDWAESPVMRRGSSLDRNTELLLPAPFDLSSITDAELEAQHMGERARILAYENRTNS